MKIALISPHFPPQSCGVGDYAARLAAELAVGGDVVRVWCAEAAPRPVAGVEITSHPGLPGLLTPWGPAAFRRIADEVAAWRPDAIDVQFTPNLYGRVGLNPGLPIFLRILRHAGAPVLLTAHELHYPIGFTPDRLGLGTPQLAQWLAVAAAADRVCFTYEVPANRYRKLLPLKRGRLHWLPVGANVTPPAGFAARPEEGVLLQFGSPHPSRLFDFTLAALDAIRAAHGPSVHLYMAGTAPEEVRRELEREHRLDLVGVVTGLGYLEPVAVSEWMGRARLVLAPFYDGVSTRRGSVMSALAHRRPVVTTQGYHTGVAVPWSRAVAWAGNHDRAGYAREALRLFGSNAEAEQLAARGQALYAEKFSWQAIARGMRELLS